MHIHSISMHIRHSSWQVNYKEWQKRWVNSRWWWVCMCELVREWKRDKKREVNPGNLARSSLICRCVHTKEIRCAALTCIHTWTHAHYEPCSSFLFNSAASVSFDSHCPEEVWEEGVSMVIENWEIMPSPISYLLWTEFAYTPVPLCRCLGFFLLMFFFVAFFWMCLMDAPPTESAAGATVSISTTGFFWHSWWCWGKSMHGSGSGGTANHNADWGIQWCGRINETWGTGWASQS